MLVVLSVVLLGCAPTVGDAQSSVTSTATDVGGTSATLTTSIATTSSTAATSEDETLRNPVFIVEPDHGSTDRECDQWAQDCMIGEKCGPCGDDSWWTTSCCVPIAPDPKGPGEPCTVLGAAFSGLDDCELGAMCWDVDRDTNIGECAPLCKGSYASPICADPCRECNVFEPGVFPCLTPCDPLGQVCGPDKVCYAFGNSFACTWDGSGDAGAPGDPCEYLNVCDPGSFCADAQDVPDCAGASGCCAAFCDVDAPDTCDARFPGTACVQWFAEGQGPEPCGTTGTIGACIKPQ